jgi:hypothetical protein
MTFVPMDMTHLTVSLQNDVQEWRRIINWAKDRQFIYNQNLTTTVMTGLSIATADQNAILAFVADLNNFNLLAAGQTHSTGSIFLYNCASVLGTT